MSVLVGLLFHLTGFHLATALHVGLLLILDWPFTLLCFLLHLVRKIYSWLGGGVVWELGHWLLKLVVRDGFTHINCWDHWHRLVRWRQSLRWELGVEPVKELKENLICIHQLDFHEFENFLFTVLLDSLGQEGAAHIFSFRLLWKDWFTNQKSYFSKIAQFPIARWGVQLMFTQPSKQNPEAIQVLHWLLATALSRARLLNLRYRELNSITQVPNAELPDPKVEQVHFDTRINLLVDLHQVHLQDLVGQLESVFQAHSFLFHPHERLERVSLSILLLLRVVSLLRLRETFGHDTQQLIEDHFFSIEF